jgi:hypothetical protein
MRAFSNLRLPIKRIVGVSDAGATRMFTSQPRGEEWRLPGWRQGRKTTGARRLAGSPSFRKSRGAKRSHERKTIPSGASLGAETLGIRGRSKPPERRLQPGLAAPLSASESEPEWRVSGKCERCTHGPKGRPVRHNGPAARASGFSWDFAGRRPIQTGR